LWDFPAIPNISSTSKTAHEKSARELAAAAFPQIREQKDGRLVIKGCDALGSILHVFSHVKKTFQVLLLRLEGPVDTHTPPDAVPGDWMDDKHTGEEGEGEAAIGKPSKKRKVLPDKQQEDVNDTQDVQRLKWVLEPNVAQEKYFVPTIYFAISSQEYSLGTGTMKVWGLVQNPDGDVEKRSAPKQKVKAKAVNKSQTQISNFFKPS